MRFELVSPERRLASTDDATAIRLPGADGDMTAMADHAPTITSLRPGILTVESPSGEERYAVTGGFAEIGEGVTVLAERSLAASDLTQDTFDTWVAEAKTTKDEASGDAVDAAAKLLADMIAMGSEVGLSTSEVGL